MTTFRECLTFVSTDWTDEWLVVNLWMFLDVPSEVVAIEQRLLAVFTHEVLPAAVRHCSMHA